MFQASCVAHLAYRAFNHKQAVRIRQGAASLQRAPRPSWRQRLRRAADRQSNWHLVALRTQKLRQVVRLSQAVFQLRRPRAAPVARAKTSPAVHAMLQGARKSYKCYKCLTRASTSQAEQNGANTQAPGLQAGRGHHRPVANSLGSLGLVGRRSK